MRRSPLSSVARPRREKRAWRQGAGPPLLSAMRCQSAAKLTTALLAAKANVNYKVMDGRAQAALMAAVQRRGGMRRQPRPT